MSVKRNVIANYLGQGWAALMGIAFVPLYVKVLGVESYGLVGVLGFAPVAHPHESNRHHHRRDRPGRHLEMKPSEALRTHRQAIRDIVARHLARNARVFGSVAPGATLLDLGALQIELEEALGLRVDLLTPGDLPPKFRERVLREAVVV